MNESIATHSARAWKANAAQIALTLLAAIITMWGLFLVATILPSEPLHFYAPFLLFSALLTGPSLMLAAGIRWCFGAWLSARRSLIPFAILLIGFGFVFFRTVPHDIVLAWIAMTFIVVAIALSLRRSWLWALIGGLWAGLPLASGGIWWGLYYLSPEAHGPPNRWLWLLLAGGVLAFADATVALARRRVLS